MDDGTAATCAEWPWWHAGATTTIKEWKHSCWAIRGLSGLASNR